MVRKCETGKMSQNSHGKLKRKSSKDNGNILRSFGEAHLKTLSYGSHFSGTMRLFGFVRLFSKFLKCPQRVLLLLSGILQQNEC